MAQTYTALKTRIASIFQDSGGAIFDQNTDKELELTIKDCLRDFSLIFPYIPSYPDVFQVESRAGTATSDTAGALVDATNSQFLSTDVGKIVYNEDDKIWAIVTAYVSTSQLTLSKDIFPDGNENYSIFNKGCTNTKQINIEDITDRIDIRDGDRLEYPIGTRRNIDSVDGDILTIGYDSAVNDTSETDADKDVQIFFRKYHRVSQLTTLTGAVNLIAGYDAGDTSMILDALQTSGTIEQDQEFTIAGTRGTYRVTTNAPITAEAATISFWPGLANDVDNNIVITFKRSTLTPNLESAFCKYVAGVMAINKSSMPIKESVNVIAILSKVNIAIDEMSNRINQAIKDVDAGRDKVNKGNTLINANAAGAITKVDAEIVQALADLDTGRALINDINKGGAGVPGNYAQYAAGDIRNANGYLQEAQSYFNQARADETLATNYGMLGTRELGNASQYLNQAIGHMRRIASEISIAGTWRLYQEWGERKKAEAERDMQSMIRTFPYEIYART